jgi:membrane protease YdiL (CAAX protease family)
VDEPLSNPTGELAPAPQSPFAPESPAPARAVALPEDLRAPWDFVDMIIFLFFAIGMIYVLNILLATFVVNFAGVKPENIEEFANHSAGFIVARQVAWFAVLLGYLYAVVRVRTEASVLATLGWRGLSRPSAPDAPPQLSALVKAPVLLFAGALLAILVEIATKFVGTSAHLPIQDLLEDRRSVLYLMAFGLLAAPLVEETVFRGFLYPVMARRFGIPAGVFFTGTLFGLMHAMQLWGGWGEISLLILVGIVFTAARAWSGSVTVSFLLHLGYNGFLFLGTYLATDGLRHFPTGK